MPEIVIPLIKPGVRAAVEPKTFNESYILYLNIHAQQMGADDFIYIEYCPFDKATGDRLTEDRRELRLPFWETVALVPEAAQAFGAVANAVPVLIAQYEAKREALRPINAVPVPSPIPVAPIITPPTPEVTPEVTPTPEPVVSNQKLKSEK